MGPNRAGCWPGHELQHLPTIKNRLTVFIVIPDSRSMATLRSRIRASQQNHVHHFADDNA
jgi:hypothetical protein